MSSMLSDEIQLAHKRQKQNKTINKLMKCEFCSVEDCVKRRKDSDTLGENVSGLYLRQKAFVKICKNTTKNNAGQTSQT